MKYRHLVKHVPAGLYEFNFVHNKFVTVNDVVCQYTGYSEQELLEMDPAYLLTLKSVELFKERLHHLLAGDNVSPSVEYQLKRKDGSTLWVEQNIKLMYEGGKIKGAIVAVLDISKRKQLEIQLSTAKKQWEDTFDSIPDWISIIDNRYTIIRSNKASNSIVGLSPNQVVGKRCYEILHCTKCPVSDCPGEHPFNCRQRESMDLQFKDGRWVRITLDPIGSEPEGPERFVHVVRDITDVKKQEQDLISAQKSEAFSLLSGGIAHDYNNLLSIIMGNISLLRDELTESFYQEVLEDVERACEQSKNLTHQFLTLSEGWLMEESSCDLKTVLQSAIDDVRQIKQLDVSMDIDSPHPPMEVDQTQLQMAFRNIILNAAEAMPDNGKLLIQVMRTSKFCDINGKKSGLQIVFADTGKGIKPSDISKIFDPYFSSKQLGVQKGRGLGLSVAKAVIAKHGGDITVESTSRKGTLVKVYLPVSIFKSDVVLKQIDTLSSGRPTVLMMEDEPQLQKLCKRILEGLGFGVLAASNAKEAVALFGHAGHKDINIELLLFDQAVTGGMSGTETLRTLQTCGFKGKAVVMTGSPNSPEMTDYRAYGFDDIILKPYSKIDIERVIRAVLPR